MALPDPIPTLTVDAIGYDFYRTSFGDTASVYQTANGLDVLTISHQLKSTRNRYSVRFDRKKVAADPFVDGNNRSLSWTAYAVFDAPSDGVTAAECQDLSQLLQTFLVSGTPDYDLRVLQGEI